MSINDIKQKIKPQDGFIVIIIILTGLAGFGLGQLSVIEKSREEVQIRKADNIISTSTAVSSPTTINFTDIPLSAAASLSVDEAKGLLVASKTGKKYHFPWCAGASQIAEKNKIWFTSYEEAQKAGYTAAANCKDLLK